MENHVNSLTYFSTFPLWQTVITHLQELLVRGDAVKFLFKKSKNRHFFPDAVHVFVLYYNGIHGACRQTLSNDRNPKEAQQLKREMQIINPERYWCLVWPYPNTSFLAPEVPSFFPCLMNLLGSHGHINSTVITATSSKTGRTIFSKRSFFVIK